jgi:trehalose 6-phosphate phosphatase
MKYLFDTEGRTALREFARPGTLMAFDYDGTLAAITADPARAHMHERTRTLLAAVARRWPTLVLTGRARADVLRLLGDIERLEVIGNHGMETARGVIHAERDAQRVGEWRRHLAARLQAHASIRIEDKQHSLAVHWRESADPEAMAAHVRAAAGQLSGARLVGGKMVLNIVPESAPHKGTALLGELARSGAERALFVGDDITDEDVFALDAGARLLTIRVGHDDASHAAFYLHDRDEVDALLAHLRASPQVGTGD